MYFHYAFAWLEEEIMGIVSNTVNIYQYRLAGVPPEHNIDEWIQKCLEKNCFMPIETTPDTESVGWVRFDDHLSYEFYNPDVFRFDNYYVFSLRRDVRKVPSALMKNLVEKECAKWLKERPKLSRVPFQRKAEIRDTINTSLLSRTLPEPAVYDVLWDTSGDIVTVASISTKVLDIVEHEFNRTFEGLSLVPIHPIARAEMVLEKGLHRALERINQASSRDVLLQIKKNRWIGWDFFLWLMYRTSMSSSEYKVNQSGPAQIGDRFISYLYDRFVLVEEHEEGLRKSSIFGPQKDFSEARKAIQSGKNITEAVMYFEKDDMKWRLNLKGDIFAFGSYTCPPVRVERDEMTDPLQEKQAVFYERVYLIETGLQLFNSIYADFLGERILGTWPQKQKAINEWLYQ